MSEPFIGEIRIVGFNFAPRNWAKADGQLIPISQNQALFSLYGNIYGGDGRTTFGLPDLKGRVPIHEGQGAGLSDHAIGSRSGNETTLLTVDNLPSHNHDVQLPVSVSAGGSPNPKDRFLAEKTEGISGFADAPTAGDFLGNAPSNYTGGGHTFSNMPPYLTLNFCCALTGLFPSRS